MINTTKRRRRRVAVTSPFTPLYVMHDLFSEARLIRRYKGKAKLTRTGKATIRDFGQLQVSLCEAQFTRFENPGIDRYPFSEALIDYRHFLGVVDNRLQSWTSATDFAGWCLPLVPGTRVDDRPNQDLIYYALHNIIRPFNWLGLIEEKPTDKRHPWLEELEIRKTGLFNKFIRFVDLHPAPLGQQ
ncbi:MAG: hypothetical protein GY798_29705 [Hyphomicrobiales bacterium]|nr:hypothetical protein [Hyphomicrobiales bacterium]